MKQGTRKMFKLDSQADFKEQKIPIQFLQQREGQVGRVKKPRNNEMNHPVWGRGGHMS